MEDFIVEILTELEMPLSSKNLHDYLISLGQDISFYDFKLFLKTLQQKGILIQNRQGWKVRKPKMHHRVENDSPPKKIDSDSLEINQFVMIKTNKLGIGKVKEIVDGLVTVEYFDSPKNLVVFTEKAKIENLRKVNLAEEETSRYIYYESDRFWSSGYIVGHAPNNKILVQFPNKKTKNLYPFDLYIRWDKPVLNPVDFLVEKTTETPFFSEKRQAFIKSYLMQKRSCNGVSSLLTSNIAFEPHQVETIFKVLQDPIKRYILADEVGLGKTIEAATILKQYIIDNEEYTILIITPHHLIKQWEMELTHKFQLKLNGANELQELDSFICVVSYNEIPDNLHSLNYLIVDEVHNITPHLRSKQSTSYQEIQSLAHASDNVLLLSATPVKGNEESFLSMLHLLDPENYSLSDIGSFKQKLNERDIIAANYYAFSIDNDDYTLMEILDKMTELFTGDVLLTEQLRHFILLLNTQNYHQQERNDNIKSIKKYIGEKFRIHHRLIRHLKSSPDVESLFPGLAGLKPQFYDLPDDCKSAEELLEEWRDYVLDSLDNINQEYLQEIFYTFLETLFVSPRLLKALMEIRLHGDDYLGNPTLSEYLKIMNSFPLLDGEAQILEDIIESNVFELEEESKDNKLRHIITQLLRNENQKIVVFVGDTHTAIEKYNWLHNIMMRQVSCYTKLRKNNVAEWKDLKHTSYRVLVCDSSAEEGLNLHGGNKIAIHYGLPLSATRIEQRMGRLNRYTRRIESRPVKSVTLTYAHSNYSIEWLEVLDSSLRIFDRSAASLQYLIEDETANFKADLLVAGIDCIEKLCENFGTGSNSRINQELNNIVIQDSLDSLEEVSDEVRKNCEAIIRLDEQWKQFSKNVYSWVVESLQFKGIVMGDNLIEYSYNDKRDPITLVNKGLWRKLAGYNSLRYNYKGSYDRYGKQHSLAIFRYGHPFLDSIYKLSLLDHRGTASCFIRKRMNYQVDSDDGFDVYFKFYFVVDIDVDAIIEVLKNMNILKNSDISRIDCLCRSIYPTTFLPFTIDSNGKPVNCRDINAILNMPYTKPLDQNLNNSLWESLDETFPAEDWKYLCRNAETISRNLVSSFLSNDSEYQGRVQNTKKRIEDIIISDYIAVNECKIYKTILEFLGRPIVKLDSVTTILLTGMEDFNGS